MPGAPAPAEEKGRGAGFWLLAIGAGAAVIGGIIALVLVLTGGGSAVEDAAVESCVIEADGTMVAKGWVQADEKVTLAVRFEDADGGDELDRVTVTPAGPVGRRQVWTASGSTDDDGVKKVTCVLESPG